MDWQRKSARKAAGADVRRVREDRDDYGARTPDEVRALREQAARSATVCADCFQPLAPDASVTIEGRPVLTGRGTKWWQRVPICLRCWLVNMTPSRRKSWISDQSWFAKSLERCRCEACGRPLRVCATRYRTQRVCCDDCRRSMLNARARARRRVRHEQIDCAVCGEPFTPKRNDALTCSNRCRQRLFRQRAR
jgi:predicted nucleic acid-binding Zn ribbon protein